MAIDYKVGVEIAMAGNFGEALKALSSALTGFKTQVDDVGKSLKGWGSIIGGLGLAFSGIGLGKFVSDLNAANGELQRQVTAYQLAGNSMADAMRAQQAAYAASARTPFYGVTESMKIGRELAGATQDNAGSAAILPGIVATAARIAVSSGQDNVDLQPLFKAIELRQGAIDEKTHSISPRVFQTEFDWMAKLLIAGQGQIKPQDILNFVKQAGPMAKDMDPSVLWGNYAGLMDDMGGSRTGTAATAAGRQVLGGIMSGKVANKWNEMGMLNKEGWHLNDKGGVVIDDPSKAIKGYDTFASGDVRGFMDNFVKPNLAAHGKTSNKDINSFMYEFGSTETVRRMFSSMLTGGVALDQVAERLAKIQMGDEGDKLVKGDYQAGVKSFGESMHTLATALGDAAGVAPILNKMAGGIASFAQTIAKNPIIGQIATWGGGAAAVGATAGGAALVGKGFIDLFGKGGLMGSATALNTSAVMLQEAAVALGAKGGPGLPGAGGVGSPGKMGLLAGLGWAGALIAAGGAIEQVGKSIQKDHPWLAALLGTGGSTGDNAVNKYVNDHVPLLKKLDQMVGLSPQDEGPWKNPLGRLPSHPASGPGGYGNPMAAWANGTPGAPPTVNVSPPQVQTQVNVSIDGQQLRAVVTQIVKSAMGAFGGFSTGAPSSNSGTITPAIDGHF